MEPDPAVRAASRTPDWSRSPHALLVPSVHFQLGREHVKAALAELARKLGARQRASDRAVDAAYEASASSRSSC